MNLQTHSLALERTSARGLVTCTALGWNTEATQSLRREKAKARKRDGADEHFSSGNAFTLHLATRRRGGGTGRQCRTGVNFLYISIEIGLQPSSSDFGNDACASQLRDWCNQSFGARSSGRSISIADLPICRLPQQNAWWWCSLTWPSITIKL